MTRRQALPLEREQAVTLEIAKGTIVGQHVEAVRGALERAAGTMPPVGPLADVGAQDRGPLVDAQAARDLQQLVVGKLRDGVERRRHHFHLAVRSEVRQRHLVAPRRLDAGQVMRGHAGDRVARLRQVA